MSDNVANQINSIRLALENQRAYFKDKTDGHATQIASLNTNKRIFKPKLCTMMLDTAMSPEWENYYSDASRTTGLDNIQEYGYDGYIATVEIQPSKAQRDAFIAGTLAESALVYRSYSSIDILVQEIADATARGLKMLGLEVHCIWARDNWSKLTPATFFSQFDIGLQNLMTNINCGEFITLFNECGSANILASSNYSYIETSLAKVQAKGYKTGLAGDGVITGLMNYVDIISIHSYPTISNKGTGVTIQDGIIAWELSRLRDTRRNDHVSYPTKDIWISETGTQNYYESLVWPEAYLATGTKSSNNIVQRIYQEGLLEYFKNETYIKGVSLFYLDTSAHYQLLQELYDFYLRNGGES